MSDPVVRLAHFSDVHVTVQPLPWQPRDWFTKRLTGWFNLRCLGRGHAFRHAEEVLRALVAEIRSEHRPDHLVFSGDATALGIAAEVERAAKLLDVDGSALPPGLAVPGNHDYYTPPDVASGAFERYFAPWQKGERVDGEAYPFAQRVGPLWLIGLNSCTANRGPGDATGCVGAVQLDRLRRLLERLEPGPRILVTHYPVCRANGVPEHPLHWLRDLANVLPVAGRGGVSLWLHGHQHVPYRINDPAVAPFPVICTGSATQWGMWGYNQYTIEGLSLRGARRIFDPQRGTFGAGDKFEMRLRDWT